MSLQNTKQEQRNFEELISNFHHPLMGNELETLYQRLNNSTKYR